MDLRKLKKIIDLVKDSGISEIEITEGEEKVRVVNQQVNQPNISAINISPQNIPTIQPVPNINIETTADKNATIDLKDDNRVLKSPMVGTFYSAASPTSQPYVEIGQQVSVGDTLCIVEAMKLMNEIESDRNGVIKDILVDNAQTVEFGQPLFIIE